MPDHSKIGKSNVRKGKTYERRVANLLTEYTGELFRRRRVEGRDVSTIERESTADVISVSKDINFSIEVKSGKGFSLDALLANPEKCLFTTWWHQATYDAVLVSKAFNRDISPLLFFKGSGTTDWLAIPTYILGDSKVAKLDYVYTKNPIKMNVSHTDKKSNEVIVELNLPSVSFIRWHDFASAVSPKIFFKD